MMDFILGLDDNTCGNQLRLIDDIINSNERLMPPILGPMIEPSDFKLFAKWIDVHPTQSDKGLKANEDLTLYSPNVPPGWYYCGQSDVG